MVVDYPNSKKARKVYLCLFVGSGGAQQIPKGLDGEEEIGSGKVKFEARRERSGKKGDKKRKNIKDRDWILKKKEVSPRLFFRCVFALISSGSSTGNEERRAFPTTQDTLEESGALHSDEMPRSRRMLAIRV